MAEVKNNLIEFADQIKRKNYLKDFPKVVYKYRSWSNPFHQKLILNQELYFASADQFNDPFDCNIPFIFNEESISKENRFLISYDYFKKLHPKASDSSIHERIYELQKNNALEDPDYHQWMSEDHAREVQETLGILSLTADEQNFLMWSHYADSHSGYCIGFDSIELHKTIVGSFEEVRYESDIPEQVFWSFTKNAMSEFIKRTLFTKSSVWAYEKEVRLICNGYSRKVQKLPVQLIKEIIFGCKMADETKLELLILIEKKYPNANVFEMKQHTSKFELTKQQIR